MSVNLCVEPWMAWYFFDGFVGKTYGYFTSCPILFQAPQGLFTVSYSFTYDLAETFSFKRSIWDSTLHRMYGILCGCICPYIG